MRLSLAANLFILYVDLLLQEIQKTVEMCAREIYEKAIQEGYNQEAANYLQLSWSNSNLACMYADDLSYSFTNSSGKYPEFSYVTYAQKVINAVHRWTVEYSLSMNGGKIFRVSVGQRSPKIDYLFGVGSDKVTVIATPEETKILGLTFKRNVEDKQMSTMPMLKNCFKNVRSAVRSSMRNLKYSDFETRIQVYKTYVYPIITNACEVYAPEVTFDYNMDMHGNTDPKEYPTILNKFNMLYKRFFGAQVCPVGFQIEKLPLTVEELFLMTDLNLYWKIMNRKSTLDRDKVFTLITRKGTEVEQDITDMRKSHASCPAGVENTFANRRVNFWNKIPEDIQKSNKWAFKRLVKEKLKIWCPKSARLKMDVVTNVASRDFQKHETYKCSAKNKNNKKSVSATKTEDELNLNEQDLDRNLDFGIKGPEEDWIQTFAFSTLDLSLQDTCPEPNQIYLDYKEAADNNH